MILHGHPLSGNTHKVRLLLSALGVRYEERVVDLTTGAHTKPDFLALNPNAQVPVLVDGDAVVYDAQAILVYLARKHDAASTWLPADPLSMARVVAWLSFAANEVQNGPHLARLHTVLGAPIPVDHVQAVSKKALDILEARLATRPFLELGRPTLADLAVYPCVALAPEGKVSLDRHPKVRAWIDRIRALPFFVTMPGLP